MSESMSEDEVVGSAEDSIMDSVRCDGYCDRSVYEGATVDVVAGKISEKGGNHVVVMSSHDETIRPEIDKWCTNCAQEKFGIKEEAGERSIEETNKYITPSNVLAFFLGALILYLLMLPF